MHACAHREVRKKGSREKDKEEVGERERERNPVEWNCFIGRVAGTLCVNRARRDN